MIKYGFTGQEEFKIEELTGKRRTVILHGPSLPFRPVSWDGNQRVITTYYPGNPRATQHVLGPTELPTEVKGIWHVHFLTHQPAILVQNLRITWIEDPQKLRDVVQSIRRSGQELRVSWGGIMRTGRITVAKFPHERLEDIGWEVTFEWNGQGENRPQPVYRPPPPNLSFLERLLQGFLDAVEAVNDVFDAIEGNNPMATGFSVRTLMNAARKIQFLVSQATALVERAAHIANLPTEIANSFANIAVNIRAQVNNMSNALASTSTETMAAGENAERMLEAYSSFHLARYQAEKLSVEATRQAKLRLVAARGERGNTHSLTSSGASQGGGLDVSGMENVYLDVVVGKTGQSLRDLANTYYGDADAWQLIADANNLQGSVLSEGVILIIPRRRGV